MPDAVGELHELADMIAAITSRMQSIAAPMPLSIQIEVNNLREVVDLLYHKLALYDVGLDDRQLAAG